MFEKARSGPIIRVNESEFFWTKDKTALKDISFEANPGDLVAVVGKTGSDKSSLLMSICGEVEMTKGTGAVVGSIALVEQEFYNKVIFSCALSDDVSNWKNGDQTMIGERGINISGAEIYVLDDPLSAVDAHVKRHILDHVIMDSGLLAGKIRIMVTHEEKLLPYFDTILQLDSKGSVTALQQDPRKYQPKLLDAFTLFDATTDDSESDNDNLKSSLSDELDEEEDCATQDLPSSGSKKYSNWDNACYVLKICGLPTLTLVVISAVLTPLSKFIFNGYRLAALKKDSSTDAESTIGTFRSYADLEREKLCADDAEIPEQDWPAFGKIEFNNFSMKYRQDLEYALKEINLTIKPGEKVGIVGRTGAGKTSLARCLFRLVSNSTCSGSILIDGHNIQSMNIRDVRAKLGSIPQEPTLFDGTFRQNLDPLVKYTVEDMWSAIAKCGIVDLVQPKLGHGGDSGGGDAILDRDGSDDELLKEIERWNQKWNESGWMMRTFLCLFVRKPTLDDRRVPSIRPHGLDRYAKDTFSNGQKQLVGLCRLLMRNRKIIVLDEATANVDPESDQNMHRVIHSEFKNCTVLTIAHRLETIMNSDRIIVMDSGSVAEIGRPEELLEKKGYFSELVKANDFGE
ncbi:ABC transporter C member 13 [Coemansia sp. RSA 1843]|nr:ABC transporter C member 13 [Coemansia sp. RSA 1843]